MKKVAPKHPQTFYLQALLAFREGISAAAREAIQLHLKAAPNSLLGLLLGAQIDYQLGCLRPGRGGAPGHAARALPNQPVARSLLVQTYLREGKPAKALEALKPMLADEKLDSDTLALAGEVLHAEWRCGERRAVLREGGGARSQEHGQAHRGRAFAPRQGRERARARASWRRSPAEDTGIRADLALVATNMRQKKFDAALAAVAAIEKKQPDKPLPHNLRGGVLLAKGDVAGARRSFERALAIDPAYFPAPRIWRAWTCGRRSPRTRRSASRRSWPRIRRAAGATSPSPGCVPRRAGRPTKSPR